MLKISNRQFHNVKDKHVSLILLALSIVLFVSRCSTEQH
jgi:hypothetical protein